MWRNPLCRPLNHRSAFSYDNEMAEQGDSSSVCLNGNKPLPLNLERFVGVVRARRPSFTAPPCLRARSKMVALVRLLANPAAATSTHTKKLHKII